MTSACCPPAKPPARRSTASSTPPTNVDPWPSPATCTPQGSTPSCPRHSPPRPSTDSCTTPTSCSPKAPHYGSPKPPPDEEWCPWNDPPPGDQMSADRDITCPQTGRSAVRRQGSPAVR